MRQREVIWVAILRAFYGAIIAAATAIMVPEATPSLSASAIIGAFTNSSLYILHSIERYFMKKRKGRKKDE